MTTNFLKIYLFNLKIFKNLIIKSFTLFIASVFGFSKSTVKILILLPFYFSFKKIKMKKIDFTVLMCTCYFDNPKLLKLSIESIFKNTITPDFFILTIDGKIPKTNWEIINKLSEKYEIQINIIKKNVGLALGFK